MPNQKDRKMVKERAKKEETEILRESTFHETRPRNEQAGIKAPAAQELSLGTLALYGAFAPYALLRDWSYYDFY